MAVGVGEYGDYAATLSGTTWMGHSPVVGGPPLAGLSTDSCASALFCVAVGWYYDELGTLRPVIETWNGTSWRATLPPPPFGATYAWLYDVSCGAVGHCVAVGGGAWAYVLGNGVWKAIRLPGTGAELASVSCSTATSCVAVGFQAAGSHSSPLAEVLTGRTWRALTPHAPDAALYAVSCWAARRCVVLDAHTQRNGLVGGVVSLNGAVWRSSGALIPRGASDAQLNDVSCSSSHDCLLVGSYMANANASAPTTLVESGPSNGPWKLVALHGPSGLSSIGCSRAMRCLAVGEPPTYSPHDYFPGPPTLYERTPGGRWILLSVPFPAGLADVTLAGAACPPAGDCVAVGGGDVDVESELPAAVTVP